MRLGIRLILSYIVVIVVTLTVIALALWVFLNTRPAPSGLTYRQLASVVQSNLRDLLGSVSLQGLRSDWFGEFAQERLAQFAQEYGVRVLVARPEGRVIFDSAGVFAPNMAINFTIDPSIEIGVFRPGLQALLRNRVDTVFGQFEDPSGQTWLFLGLARAEAATVLTLFADLPPDQTLVAALSEFGRELVRPLIQAGVIGLLVAIVMAALISRTVARPLQHIAEAAAAVAQRRYDRHVPVEGPTEIRAVAAAVNRMSADVRAAQESQRDFVANVSHDLKTPLTSIQGYSQAIIDGAVDDPGAAASVIYEEAARLNRMVVELTDLARLENGQFSFNMQPVNLNQVVEGISQRLGLVAQKKNLVLAVETVPLPVIQADGDRLAQVITNVLSNAIKYTPAGGRISVRTQVENGGVALVVQDNGAGIPAEDLPRIFERFYQVDKARGPRRGTGLGLAIAQQIVQAHQGRIRATSDGPGKGSTFTVWLPSSPLKTAAKVGR